jgi:hemoglobin
MMRGSPQSKPSNPSGGEVPAATSEPDPRGDLDTRASIHDLVVAFYREIVFDDLLAPVFDEVAETDWAVHIPRLVDYWCRILLGERGYNGALLEAHREVHRSDPLRDEHFDRWYDLWVASIDARWRGPRAEQAKAHAAATAGLISRRLRGVDHDPRGAAPAASEGAR